MSSTNVNPDPREIPVEVAPFKVSPVKIARAKVIPTKSRGPRQRKQNRPAKQEALILAAKKLFASKGYESTTTREIASAAGCAEGLIHRYFKGKAGLLSAIIEYRVSREVVDLRHELRPAATLGEEFLQLVDWEVDRMWKDRDFLRVAIPRALLDPAVRKVMNRAVMSRRGHAILGRLKHFEQCQRLQTDEIDALAQSVGVLGMIFGFMRPLVLGEDRNHAKKLAANMATVIVQGL